MAFVDPLASFSRGQALVNDFAGQLDQRRAARGVASGNYAEALSALGNMGDIGGVIQVQNAQAQGEERQRQRREADLAQQVAFSRQATRALSQAIQSGQDPLTTFDGMVPAFQALGATPDQVQTYRQALAANPTAFVQQIEQLTNTAARQLEILNLGGGNAVALDKATGEVVNEYRAPQGPINLNGVLVDPDSREVILDTREPKYQTIQNTDGSTSVVAIDQPAPIRGSGGGGGTFESVIGPLLQREGGFVAQDGRSGAPANFGINQRANPDVDVRSLTPDRAAEIYRERYWNPVVQAGVPEYAREAVFDFAVNAGPQRALEAWRRSGGDIDAFNEQRLAHYRRQPDYAQNGRSWERRVAETTPATVDTRGGARVVAQGENRGLTPAQQRQEEKDARSESNALRRDEVGLRREFNNRQEVKDFRTIQAAYNSVQAAAQNPSAAGDLSLIFAYMKILDPGSVVREQEFANAQNAAGVPDQVRNLYNRALNGQRLNPRQRQDFLNQAQGLYQSRRQTYDQIAGEYRSYAQDYGVSPDRVAPIDQPSNNNRPRTNAPGLRFNITEPQLATRQRIVGSGGRSSSPLGSAQNPYYINPADASASYANVRRGAYFVTPDGQVRGPKP